MLITDRIPDILTFKYFIQNIRHQFILYINRYFTVYIYLIQVVSKIE